MRKVKLKSNGVGRYDDISPFLIESGALELKIELPAKSGEFYLVTELNGKSLGALLIPKGGMLSLDGLEAGELKAAVKHYLRGELIEVYKVEPLLLKAVDKELSAMPEIAILTSEIEKLRKEIDNLYKDAEETVKATQEGFKAVSDWQYESDTAFLSFAYVVYENSPLLNGRGLTFAEFAAVLGFEEITEKIELGGKL